MAFPGGISPAWHLESKFRKNKQALDDAVDWINTIQPTTAAPIFMDELAKLRPELADNRDTTMDKLDRLKTNLAETRNKMTTLWQDLQWGLDQRTLGILELLQQATDNTTRLSETSELLLNRMLKHQTHLEHPMGFKEQQHAQMHNHWRALEDLKANVLISTFNGTT
jgi:hypothetical protein